MTDPQEVAKAFTQHYYQTFDANAQALAGLFKDTSMMTFEGSQFLGTQNIIQKFVSFGRVQHTVKTLDVQPSTHPEAIIIFVTGHVVIGDVQPGEKPNPLHFSEFFHLIGQGGNYHIHNDVFRLNYGL